MATRTQSTHIQIENKRIAGLRRILLAAALVTVVAVGALAVEMRAVASARTPGAQALPFGPNWAADYGVTHRASIDSYTKLPFGPGWAANYGTESSYPLPFGPEIAATYGARSNTTLPFGPGHAATYGVPAR